MRIQTWITIMIIGVLFIAGIISSVSLQSPTKDVFTSEAEKDNSRVIIFVNEIIQTHLAHLESVLQVMSEDPRYLEVLINEDNPELVSEISNEMTLIEKSTVAIENIRLFSKGGMALATDYNSFSVVGTNLSDRDYITGVLKTDDEYLSEVFFSTVTKSPQIALSMPVRDYALNIRGVVAATLDSSDMQHHLNKISQDRFDVVILDRNEQIVFSTLFNITKVTHASENHFTQPIYQMLRQGKESRFMAPNELDHIDYYISYEKFEDYTIIVYKPSSFVEIPQGQLGVIVMELIVAILLFILLFMWIFSRSISRPLSNLSNDIDKITKGDLDIELGHSKLDEIQAVTDALNRVLASLKLAILRTGATKRDVGLGEAIKARKEAEARYKSLFEVIPSAVYTLNAEDKVTSWNDQAESVTGYTLEELQKKGIEEIKGLPTSVDRSKIPLLGEEYKIKTKDGKERYISLNADNLLDAGANVTGTILSFSDITEKKNAEQELRDSRERYKNMFDNSPEAIVIFDKKGNMVDANDRLKDWLDFDPKDYPNINLMRMPWLTRKSKAIALKKFTARMLGSKLEPYILEFKSKSGKKVLGRIFATPIKERGESVGDLIMISDVTLEMEKLKKEKERKK